jgi:hypothetical protein
MMRKTTAPRKPSRRKVQRASRRTGLIAKAKTPRRSVETKSALDNRSHRTPKFSCERIKKKRMRSMRNPCVPSMSID